MNVDWFRESVSSELAEDLVRLLMLLALALLGPFVVVFQEPSHAWELNESTFSLFSSVIWASITVTNPGVYTEQTTFVLLPVLAAPVLLFIAIVRVWFAISVIAHRRDIWKTADLAISGSLMFVTTLIICISVTFNMSLPGLPWDGFIPIPSDIPPDSVCYPFPVLYLAGLLCGSRRSGRSPPPGAPQGGTDS